MSERPAWDSRYYTDRTDQLRRNLEGNMQSALRQTRVTVF
jgi:hypothetical protein